MIHPAVAFAGMPASTNKNEFKEDDKPTIYDRHPMDDQVGYDPFDFVEKDWYTPLYTKYDKNIVKEEGSLVFQFPSRGHWAGGDRVAIDDDLVTRRLFFKAAPLIDPFQRMLAKDNNNNKKKRTKGGKDDTPSKLADPNNASYVDHFAYFLGERLLHEYGMPHAVDYYGGWVGVQRQFRVDLRFDLDSLMQSRAFRKKLETKEIVVDESALRSSYYDNDHDAWDEDDDDDEDMETRSYSSSKVMLDIGDEVGGVDFSMEEETLLPYSSSSSSSLDVALHSMSLADNTPMPLDIMLKEDDTMYLNGFGKDDLDNDDDDDLDDDDDDLNNDDDDLLDEDEEEQEEEEDEQEEEEEEDDDFSPIYGYLPNVPVQMIALEQCDDTLESLLLGNKLDDDEMIAALFQVIMTLLAYQKAYAFTHNDLHAKNIMFVKTDEVYLTYKFDDRVFRVPTYGRIFKLIDFGRAWFQYQGQVYASDSFASHGDAFGQYNSEPYYRESKPRVDPNPSFDLCRLACALYPFYFDDDCDLQPETPLEALVHAWCLDDEGRHMVVKPNGRERYPDFKLYLMIARNVHAHTPQAQLDRDIFQRFVLHKNDVLLQEVSGLVDIDAIPSFV